MNYKHAQVNAASIDDQPLGNFLHVASLLVPLYSSRAAELAFFGPDGVSLASAAPLSDCFQIGWVKCMFHVCGCACVCACVMCYVSVTLLLTCCWVGKHLQHLTPHTHTRVCIVFAATTVCAIRWCTLASRACLPSTPLYILERTPRETMRGTLWLVTWTKRWGECCFL